MATQSGYSNAKKWGGVHHETIHNLGSSRFGQHVVSKSLTERNAVAMAIENIQVDANEPEKFLYITITGNPAKRGDIVRFTSGECLGAEIEVVRVINANTFVIHRLLSPEPQIGDEVKVMYYVTSKSDAEGNVNFSPGPATFVKDSVTETVTEDSSNSSNNKGLPSLVVIYKNGVQVPVADSDSDPNDVVAVPVKITDVGGTNINITAGDINVQTSDMGANFDSMRIGDGSGVYLKIEADGSINAIVDQSVVEGKLDSIEDVLDLINGKDFATETKLEAVRLLISSLDGKDFATETTLDAVSTKLDSLATSAGQSAIVSAIQNIVFDKTGLATTAKQDDAYLKLTEMDLALDSIDGKATTTNTALGTANTKLTEIDNAVDAMSAKLPATLGAKTKALSLSITPATDSGLATEAKQDSGIAELTAIKNSVSAATFIPKTYDEVALTYNGAGDIDTVTYKLASATIATLTLSYTDGNLTGVVKS